MRSWDSTTLTDERVDTVMAGIVDRKLMYTPFDDTIHKRKVINQSFMRMVEILSV